MNEQLTSPRRSYTYPLIFFLTAVLLASISFGAGWTSNWILDELGFHVPLPDVPLPNGQRLRPTTSAAVVEEESLNMSIFWEAMTLLDENFYAQEELPRSSDLTYAAIEGVLASTDDPHTSFMTPEDAARFESDLEGEFEGIGARVDMGEEGLVIVAPLPGTPASEAGLQPGDIVLEIDGEPTQGMDLIEAISLVRGERGTVVQLTIRRSDTPDLLTFDITRANVIIPVVETRLIEEEGLPPIGYIQLTDFGRTSVSQFKEGLEELEGLGAEKLILDLRFNPGGLLDASVEITSQFIHEGVILTEKNASDLENTHVAQRGGLALDIPLVVLINEGSASASEIVAGAIQDTARGTLVGTTSFGKGSVQRLHNLSDSSLLRLTVARWFTPNGNAIHDVGIQPDIYLEVNLDELAPDEDPQLDAAIQYFRDNP